MIKLEHLTIKENQRHLFQDVSFIFSRNEIVSFCAETDCEERFVKVLAGIEKPDTGILTYEHVQLVTFTSEERSAYRNTYVTSLYADFQIVASRKVTDTICMQIEYAQGKYNEICKSWGISNITHKRMEDITFEQQMRVVLARAELKGTRLLLVYPDSTPFSIKERHQLYELLRKSAMHCSVVIVGDKSAQVYAQRLLVMEHGYILSDSSPDVGNTSFSAVAESTISYTHWIALLEKKKHHYRWAYRMMKLAMFTVLLFVSISLFCSQLNVVNIEMGLLTKNGQTAFTIDKLAKGNDGTIYANQYAMMEDEDISELSNHVKGTLLKGYSPIDTYYANAYLEGVYSETQIPITNSAVLYEAENSEELGFTKIIGKYPSNYDEVALSYQAAMPFLKSLETYDSLINKTISWYGVPLKITGIFLSENQNLHLDTLKNSPLTHVSNARYFVRKGFLKQHPIHTLKSFPLSFKRILLDNRAMNMNAIYGNEIEETYTDGSAIYPLKELEEDEVVIDFNTAVMLGFDYKQVMRNPALSVDDRMQAYVDFAKIIQNDTITVQAYTIATSASNSVIFQKKVRIKGVISPKYAPFENETMINPGSVYMKQSVVEDIQVENAGIQSVYYHSDSETNRKETLQYLHKSTLYQAHLPESNLFQFSVLDMKNLSTFFLGCSFLLISSCIVVFLLLQQKTREELKKDVTLFYTFGVSEQEIRKKYRKHAFSLLLKTLFVSSLFSAFFLGLYAFVLCRKLFVDKAMMAYVLLPCLLAVGIYIIFRVSFYIYFHRKEVVVKSYRKR